jgi:hypothetical protein
MAANLKLYSDPLVPHRQHQGVSIARAVESEACTRCSDFQWKSSGQFIGIGAIILFAAAGIVLVRWLTSKITHREQKSRAVDPTERDQILEDVQVRFGELDQLKQRISELEERVDFAERLSDQAARGATVGTIPGLERRRQ